MRRIVVLALAAAVPIAGFALWSAMDVLPFFFDECHVWDHDPGEPVAPRSRACPEGRTASGLSAAEAGIQLLALQGGLLAGASAGVAGAVTDRSELLGAATIAMGLEAGLLGLGASPFALVVVVAAVVFGWATWLLAHDGG